MGAETTVVPTHPSGEIETSGKSQEAAASGLFDEWGEDCPLSYSSNNAPLKRDVLGTLVLSVLSGHCQYAHISAIRGDGINPELLGMMRVASNAL